MFETVDSFCFSWPKLANPYPCYSFIRRKSCKVDPTIKRGTSI